MMKRNKGQLGKKILKSNYVANQNFKSAKFSKTSIISHFSKFNQGEKTLVLNTEDQDEHAKRKLYSKCHSLGIEALNAHNRKKNNNIGGQTRRW
jgi:hypothetical protein